MIADAKKKDDFDLISGDEIQALTKTLVNQPAQDESSMSLVGELLGEAPRGKTPTTVVVRCSFQLRELQVRPLQSRVGQD